MKMTCVPLPSLVRLLRRPGPILAVLVATSLAAPAQDSDRHRLLDLAEENPRLLLEERRHEASDTIVLQGTYRVYEDRQARTGREIDLALMVLPATGDDLAPDPVVVFHGGPGAAATGYARSLATSWLRERRDIVLVDQRGTGRSNPLRVPLLANDENLQGYFDSIFQSAPFEAARAQLEEIADLTKYTTPIAADDMNEVREALGYGKINLRGGSYGSRAALIYMRRHPDTVRTATLNGIAPVEFLNPLFHAQAAQEGFERILAEIRSDRRYRNIFADLDDKLAAILSRLEDEPATVAVTHPATGEAEEIRLDRDAFAEALRVMMYYLPTNRQVPALLLRAYEGDYVPFAQRGLESNRGIRNLLCFGMLMCVVGSEDIPRIDPSMIPRLTEDTFLGDARVRTQMEVAKHWPRGDVPANYGDPVSADVPVLLWSGTHDPVTPPRWGEEAARSLPRCIHLTVPAAHGVGGACIAQIEREFLESGTLKDLDTSCVEELSMAPLALPGDDD